MDLNQVEYLFHRAMYVATIVAMPILIICLVLGIIISIFQAATQIHEQSLTFVPKIVVVVLILFMAGGWMTNQVAAFAREVFAAIANIS